MHNLSEESVLKSLTIVEKNEFKVGKFRIFALGDPRYPIDTRLRDILFHHIKASTYTFHLRPKLAKSTWTFFP